MAIHTSAVGTKRSSDRVVVSARRLLAYAAGLGATAEALFDDAREGGMVGLPPFCVSLEWPVVRVSGGDNEVGATRDEALRGVHVGQDSQFHRVIRPGDELVTDSVLVEVRATGAGAYTCTKLSTRDARSGEPVVTSWYGSIFRGVNVVGDSQCLERAPDLPAPDLSEGQSGADAAEVVLSIAREAPHVYTECADIWNPIHTERAVALAAGLPDIILHGTATWAHAACQIIELRAGGDPARLKRLSGRFVGMVIPGTEISIQLGRVDRGVVSFSVRDAQGRPVIGQGVAEIG